MPRAPKITQCRVCKNPELVECLDLGEQYLSSIFPESLDYRGTLPRYPLDLVLCRPRDKHAHCGLLQLGHALDLGEMYQAYPYASGSHPSMKRILQDVAESGLAFKHLEKNDWVLDIGCNDGTLLTFFKGRGWKLLGIDAAQNIQPVPEAEGIPIVSAFFSKEVFRKWTGQNAKLVFSTAMFYHLADPVAFSKDVEACLDEKGIWVVQMAYLPAMLKTNMYDNIVHEHTGYYGIETLDAVMKRSGLKIFDVELNEVYGGSYRVFIKKASCQAYPPTPRYRLLLKDEQALKLTDPKTYRRFRERIEKTRSDLCRLIHGVRAKGMKIWVYGASTKGNTILQYCGLGKDEIEAAADANPFKFGKFVIGADLPIHDETAMRKARPEYLLALPYSFVENFLLREEALVRQGTRFIVPLPNVKIYP